MKKGDKVRFIVENDNDIYSYEVPNYGEIGIIKELGIHQGYKYLFGIDVGFHLVEFDGMECSIFEHDLRKCFSEKNR